MKRIAIILGILLGLSGLGAVPSYAAAKPHIVFAGVSAGPGTPVLKASPSAPTYYAYLSNFAYNPMHLNGTGGSCGTLTHIVGWGAIHGITSNELFNTYENQTTGEWFFQARWCPNNGTLGSGLCIWDNSQSNHGLVLYPCDAQSSIDGYYLLGPTNDYTVQNAYWKKYINCTETDGQWCWDGGLPGNGQAAWQVDWEN